jgi:hypothetical protein
MRAAAEDDLRLPPLSSSSCYFCLSVCCWGLILTAAAAVAACVWRCALCAWTCCVSEALLCCCIWKELREVIALIIEKG